jgi:SOS-response transcriptional repressor LexA
MGSLESLRTGEYLVIDLAQPGRAPEAVGVVLLDPADDRAYVRMRRDWADFVPDEADVLEGLEDDLDQSARQLGARAFLTWMEETLSNDLRTGDRERVTMIRPERTLADLYRSHVSSTVRRFQTHLPLYAARAAATKFSGQQSVAAPEDWVEAPAGLKLDEEMFVARVEGRSMEGAKVNIPSGSLCVFRGGVKGSRQGRLVLVEKRSARGGESERYTIKQYWSEKVASPEGWQHTRILLKPLNPEFETWELDDSGEYAVIGEFVTVLE